MIMLTLLPAWRLIAFLLLTEHAVEHTLTLLGWHSQCVITAFPPRGGHLTETLTCVISR